MVKGGGYHGTADSSIHDSHKDLVEKMPEKIAREWSLSYRFYPHFHPYATALVNRLIEKSVRGLQAADTEYEYVAGENDGTLAVLPDSTLVSLDEDVNAKLAGTENRRTVFKGTKIFLPDGTSVALSPNGPSVTMPGNMIVLTQPRGMRFLHLPPPGDSTQDVPFDNNKLALTQDVNVRVPEGLLVTIPANTNIVLHDCKPKPALYDDVFLDTQYNPSQDLVERPYPVKDLDFTSSGAYSVYNWELFYHVPLTIAINLSKNQRFEEAQKWFHYIFDPTDDSDGPTPERYWKVKPFQYNTDIRSIEEILVNLSSGVDPKLQHDTVNSINAWKDAPFRPHVVARYRQTAYMFKTVMAYLDNLIAWGDNLFRQDTGESINEATQVYILAANILGPRPQAVPKKGSIRPQTYYNLKADLDQFGNHLVDLEPDISFDLYPQPNGTTDHAAFSILSSIGKALYFCVPRNDKLLSYWDTVADRLFKIRNSLNIQGIFRQLPLFEPPIDPALLARAAAAGLDVGAIIAGLNQPLPLVRFQLLVQKAAEISQEVKTLGNSLLSALEKEDNEALAILRASHERIILGMVETVKYAQLQEAIKAREGLEVSLQNSMERYAYFERLLGKKDDIIGAIPALSGLDKTALGKATGFESVEPEVKRRDIEVDIAEDLNQSGGKIISSHELQELEKLKSARGNYEAAANMEISGSLMSNIPEFGVDAAPFGGGADVKFGGQELSKVLSLAASTARTIGEQETYEASNTARIGTYARREQDWASQSNLAVGEINQTFKQLRAAQIREAIAERELENHRQQIKRAEEIEQFLMGEETSIGDKNKHKKTSTQDFYAWMKREIRGLYSQCFQFAFDIAKKAERALQYELGDTNLSFLQFGYLAGKEGLLAGEKLYLDIKRMEMAYHDLNQREYELTKHVSLHQVDPLALIQLRTTGSCTVRLPEELFDMDGPGHYFRRIKTVALSIPCVIGPYASVNCTLTLLKSSIRTTQILRDGAYAQVDAEDARFNSYFGSLQSIVTSSAQSDSGLFETNLRDERYLPFENSGVISEWQLQLPANPSKQDPALFDYSTISDVILHIRYTAREGGGLLRKGAIEHFKELIKDSRAVGSIRLFSIRHEFPTEWAKFQEPTATGARAELKIKLRPEHYPYWSQGRLNSVVRVDILGRSAQVPVPSSVDVADRPDKDDATANKDPLVKTPSLGNLLVGKLVKVPMPAEPADEAELNLFFDTNTISDLWIAVTWNENE
jgi:hypothetical protein